MRRLAGIISCWNGLVEDGAAASIAVLGSRPPTSVMETNEENLAHVAELIEKAKAAGLKGADWVESLGVKRCCEGYNGIGPEFLPPALRAKVTDCLHIFEPAALIHDARNHVSDGSRKNFERANDEFLWNCRKLADFRYPWYSWKRYRARLVAAALYDFVSGTPGWIAWQQAHERFVQRQNKENNQ